MKTKIVYLFMLLAFAFLYSCNDVIDDADYSFGATGEYTGALESTILGKLENYQVTVTRKKWSTVKIKSSSGNEVAEFTTVLELVSFGNVQDSENNPETDVIFKDTSLTKKMLQFTRIIQGDTIVYKGFKQQ